MKPVDVNHFWRDFGDSMSYLHRADGKVLAEIISSRYDRWSIKVNGRARGLWIGRDLAKAACERIVEMEWPGRIVEIPTPKRRPLWQRLKGWLDGSVGIERVFPC